MFTRYWRSYPWFLQLFLFGMMIFIFLGLGSALLYSMPKLTGIPLDELVGLNAASKLRSIRAAVCIQGIVHLCTFAAPCLLFAYLTHPRPLAYLGLTAPKNKLHLLLVPVIMIGLMLVTTYAETFLSLHVKLSESLQKEQLRNNEQIQAMLSLRKGGDLLALIFVLAILPAFGEELMFRGLFIRFSAKRSRSMIFPVLISALFFMMVHSNPLGMPFIFIAGVVLGLIYWLTGSLWLSVLGHFIFNGVQVALAFWTESDAAAAAPQDLPPVWLPLLGLALFLGAGYALIKTKRPLPAGWTDDYRGEERDTPPSPPFSLS